MPRADVTLPGSASSVPAARRFVESLVSAWGHPELGWNAALVVSELATNAALHARTAFTISVLAEDSGRLRLEVSDSSRRLPQQRAYGIAATTGRGLRLVDEIASSWGVLDRDGGKTVWAVLGPSLMAGHEDDEAELDEDALLSAYADNPAPSGRSSAGEHGHSARWYAVRTLRRPPVLDVAA